MVSRLVALQAAWIGRDGRTPQDRPARLAWPGAYAGTGAIHRAPGRRARSPRPPGPRTFVADLPRRFAAIEACGLPDTIVHGDFHPGNVRGDAGSLVLLDWGDCGVGHPMLDMSAFLDRVPPAAVDRVRTDWLMAWRTAVPGSDPDRAAALLAPVASRPPGADLPGLPRRDRSRASTRTTATTRRNGWLGPPRSSAPSVHRSSSANRERCSALS